MSDASFIIHDSQKFSKLKKKYIMSTEEKDLLKDKIKNAIKISSQKLIEKKRALGQQIVISEGGKIRVIEP